MIFMERFINADNCVAGRLSSQVAKMLLKGDKIVIFNAEKAVISGSPRFNENDFKHEIGKGDPYNGPFFPKESNMILKRMVRGMLPKKPRGIEAFRNLKVYRGVPEEFKDKKPEVLDKAVNRLECKFITLSKISGMFGAK